MAVKINITQKKGKMLNSLGQEVYDERFQKHIENYMGKIGGNKRNGEDKKEIKKD
jgi:hypothetical protein